MMMICLKRNFILKGRSNLGLGLITKGRNTTTNRYSQTEIKLDQAVEIETPTGIVNFLQKRNGLLDYDSTGRYYLTEVIDCSRKSFYKQIGVQKEELVNDATVEKMWGTVRGDFLHQITRAYKWREMDMELYLQLKSGKTVTISGRLDMYDWKTKTIMDLKTTKMIRWQVKQGFIPRFEHILQVQCYGTMFSQIVPVENLDIVYADMSDIVTYKVQKRNLLQWMQNRIQEIEEAISQGRIPKGETSGLCQFCPYQTRCFNDGNGLLDKPLSSPRDFKQ